MKAKIIIPLLVILSICSLKAQEAPSQHFRQAFEEISAMVEGKQPLDFEKAVFITENAYRDNSLNYEDFKSALNVHSAIIEQFIKANDKYDWKQFVRGNMGIAPDMEIEAKERYRKALANYAIFTYLTDTLTVKLEGQEFLHLPYTYSNDDPFGTADWKNSQTMNLLETQKGNCYSLVTLFKIFSERFKSEANIVTAPQHIYIEHRDPKGSRFNVEVATRSFPDMGSIQTLTYTTREALLNDISMRKLDLKQSVGLNLVYLAKGYEYKNKVKDDEFILACANTALQHDPKNLNALLLKAQVYEHRVMKKKMPSAPYEKMLAEFYKLGYRQMPDDMKEIILSKIQGRPSTVTPTDKTPNTFADIGEQSRTVTLSNGLFEELHTPQKIVRYGQTIFDTEKSKIVKFLDEDISSYQVDPVVFALSIDPLTKSYPWYTPYQFAGNQPIVAIDMDGLEPLWSTVDSHRAERESLHKLYGESEGDRQFNINRKGEAIGSVVGVAGGFTILSLPSAGSVASLFYRGLAFSYANPQIIIGATGLTASLLDPNPNSDYPGGLDDVVRGSKLLFKSSKGIERFSLAVDKFDFFFGKVKAGINATQRQLDNAFKSNERLGLFKQLGIEDTREGREKLVGLFDEALQNGEQVEKITNDFGTTISKRVNIQNGNTKGHINVSFFYEGGDLTKTPSISTAVPVIPDKK